MTRLYAWIVPDQPLLFFDIPWHYIIGRVLAGLSDAERETVLLRAWRRAHRVT